MTKSKKITFFVKQIITKNETTLTQPIKQLLKKITMRKLKLLLFTTVLLLGLTTCSTDDVVPTISVTSVTITPPTLTLIVGETGNLSATVAPGNATNQNVSWSSINPEIVSVGSNGQITAVAVGTATIVVSTQDGGRTATSTITVNPLPVKCEVCGEFDCETAHKECAICGAWDCEEEHAQCPVCGEYNCEVTHVQCPICDEYDCEREHQKCEICDAWDCEVEHILCPICNDWDCEREHQKCEVCGAWDCEETHIPDRVSQDVTNLVLSVPSFPEEPVRPIQTVTSEVMEERTENGITTEWRCEIRHVTASHNPSEFVMFNPSTDVLWPGSLVQGRSLVGGSPDPIPVGPELRQPGTIFLPIVAGISTTLYRPVEEMTPSGVNQAMNDILHEFLGQGGQGYARYFFQMETVYSYEHLNFLLNARFSGPLASTRAGFSRNFSREINRVLVRLYQAYFTMAFDNPHGIDGVFTPEITVNHLRNYTGAGNPITYISSVTFGRKFYLLYEYRGEVEDLKRALNASFRGFGASGSVGTQEARRRTLEQTTAQVFQIGGDAAGGITAAMAVDYDAIRDFLERGMNFDARNVGAPISFTVRYLSNARLVRLGNTLNFEDRDCRQVSVDMGSDTFRINFYDYHVSVTHNHRFEYCHHYLAIEVGKIRYVDGIAGREILARSPATGVPRRYGSGIRGTFPINFAPAEIKIARNNILYIRFMVRNVTRSSRANSGSLLGSRTPFPDDTSYEKTILFKFIPNENRWIAKDKDCEIGIVNTLYFSTTAVNSPSGISGGFAIQNTFNYSVEIIR